jgi:hypothetical protein
VCQASACLAAAGCREVTQQVADLRHPLLDWQPNGWIDHGVLHRLPPHGGAAFADAW